MARRDRKERERAGWLLANESSWHLSDRRMANQLKRRAAKRDRAEAGATESLHHEGQIKPLLSRFFSRSVDSSEGTFRVLFVVLFAGPLCTVAFGLALGVSQLLYLLYSTVALARGAVPRSWPWYAAGGVALVAAGVWLWLADPLGNDRWGMVWLVSQAVLAVFLTGIHVRRHGWPGVKTAKAAVTPLVLPPIPETPAAAETPDVQAALPEATDWRAELEQEAAEEEAAWAAEEALAELDYTDDEDEADALVLPEIPTGDFDYEAENKETKKVITDE